MTRFSRPAFPIPPSTLTPGTCGRRVHDTSLMVDVFVIGGGPAGAAAARLLASWGWSVALAHRASRRPSLAESLPPSTRKVLALIGLLDDVEAASFHPNFGNFGHWADRPRTTTITTSGFHVARADFDAVLRASAARSGVRMM